MIILVVKILLVDADHLLLSVSKRILEMEKGFDVDTSTSVDDAINKVRVQRYDVIISDYEMPDKDRITLFLSLRDGKYRLPFILLYDGENEVAKKSFSMGINRCIFKYGSVEALYIELKLAIESVIPKT